FTPLTIRESDGILFFASLAVFMILLRHKEFRLSADQILALLLFGVLTLWARRNAAWYGFVVAPILAGGLQARWGRFFGSWPGIRWANIVLLGVLFGGAIISLPWWRHRLPLPPPRRELAASTTPMAAMDFLCSAAPEGARTYQHQVFGSYQIWACPKLPIFINTRIELYPEELWQEYFDIESGRYNWESITDKYQIRYLILSPREQPKAIEAARSSPRWQEIYRDDRAVIFERK
ncbi:MAG TPA: hypothetical protein VNJ09_09910, partial [Chthonomonadales bacterium]|nr:hypothetical protein [Chthonomonadales bacterium]